jgi:hypothetical protein
VEKTCCQRLINSSRTTDALMQTLVSALRIDG